MASTPTHSVIESCTTWINPGASIDEQMDSPGLYYERITMSNSKGSLSIDTYFESVYSGASSFQLVTVLVSFRDHRRGLLVSTANVGVEERCIKISDSKVVGGVGPDIACIEGLVIFFSSKVPKKIERREETYCPLAGLRDCTTTEIVGDLHYIISGAACTTR